MCDLVPKQLTGQHQRCIQSNYYLPHNIQQTHQYKMFDQCLIDRSLLHKLSELSNLSYLHSNLHLHRCRMFEKCLVGKFPLHKRFGLQILC